MTYREYQMRLAWLEIEWNKPSRTDHYLMQIIRYLARIPGKGSLKSLDKFKIPFEFVTKKENPDSTKEDGEQRAAMSRGTWGATQGKFKK